MQSATSAAGSNQRLVQSDSLGRRVLAYSEESPGKRAAVCDGTALTYAELTAEARRCAAWLLAKGLSPGGSLRVGVLGPPSLDYAIVTLACQLTGVAIVPLPGLIAADALSRMMVDAGIAVVLADREYHAKLPKILPSEIQVINIGTAGARAWSSTPPKDFPDTAIERGWTSDLIYSSGTTGEPKGIAQTYEARATQCIRLGQFGVTRETRLFQSVGLYSNYGFSSLLLSLWWGATFFMTRKFSGEGAVELLAAEEIDMAWMPPATLLRTIEVPRFAQVVEGRPCIKLCAGAPLSEVHKRQVLETWSGPFFDIYGQTETGTLTMLAMHAVPPEKLNSVGQVLSTVSVKIIDDDGKEVPTGEEGEIAGHSDTLMAGYHHREDANAAAFWRDREGKLYVRTGDVGKFDDDGFLWLCDRKKDMIISGGFNIYPADIEKVLGEHPAVFENAVVGFPSARWGESPVGFVTVREGASVDPIDLQAWANERLGKVQRLAAINILPELPNGAMGKILKRELRDRFAAAIGTLP